jgi:hypothetical protein
MAVDRLHGTVAFDDFALDKEEKDDVPPLLLWLLQLLPGTSAGPSEPLPSPHETASHSARSEATAPLHAVIASPVSAYRPQGLAPPPLSSPIIIFASSSEAISATGISAAGGRPLVLSLSLLHAPALALAEKKLTFAAVTHPPPASFTFIRPPPPSPSSSGSWHSLTDGHARSLSVSPAAVTIPWPRSVIDALLASDSSGVVTSLFPPCKTSSHSHPATCRSLSATTNSSSVCAHYDCIAISLCHSMC